MIIKTRINIKSLNDNDLLNPYEFLFPLSKLVYIINVMENFDKEEINRKHQKDEIDFKRFGRLIGYPLDHNFKPRYLKDYNSVLISKINKQSPFFVELIVQVSPIVLNVIDAIIEKNQDNIDSCILEFLESKGLSSRDSEIDKENIRALTNTFRRILQFVSLSIEN
jgi:hypothetical protein